MVSLEFFLDCRAEADGRFRVDSTKVDLELASGMCSLLFCSMVCDRTQRLAVVGYNLPDCECFTQL